MEIKGLDKSYLVKTNMTAEQIAEEIINYIEENTYPSKEVTIRVMHILSAGWDAFYGWYAVVKAKGKMWVASHDEVTPYNSWARERGLL